MKFEESSEVGQSGLEPDEYMKIIHCLQDEVFVTDGEGIILFLNPTAERICGVKKEDVIGKHVSELEKQKKISSSITLAVLKTREKVEILQQLQSGKTVIAQGSPVFDEQGNIIRVIITSKDVDEINNLLKKIDKQNFVLASKEKQLDVMKEAFFSNHHSACFGQGLAPIKEMVVKVAPTDLTVLIQGESGVGKEVIAKLIHSLGPRNNHSLVKINCGLIPENLIESELFGYETGAFSGANKNGKIGKIELADHGTLFLDEIGEMPLHLQVKLLEFLQDREFTRVGGIKKHAVDTRVVAATNCDLKSMVQQGKFREDLFYRLNVFPIRIPPLRERKEDVKTFAGYFLEKFNDKYKQNKQFAPDVLDLLLKYDWPGNVREFEHVIERAVVNSEGDFIETSDLNIFSDTLTEKQGKVICTGLLPWKAAKKELQEQLIKRAYDYYKSTYKAADALDISQSTVAKVIKSNAK